MKATKHHLNTNLLLHKESYDLLNTLELFSELVKLHGYQVRAYSQTSIEKLRSTPLDVQLKIREYFQKWIEWINLENESFINSCLDKEKQFLKKALDYYNLKLGESFFENMEENDLIEIYGQDMVQLYRSLSFFKYSGYSLLDLSLYEWYVLWERPKRATEAIIQEAQRAMQNNIQCEKLNIPKHILREIYDTGKTEPFSPRAILIDFKNISSLINKLNNEIVALVCTSKAEIIAKGKEALDIQFV